MASSDILVGAREALEKSKKLTKSVEGSEKSSFAPKSVHQFSKVDYGMAKESKPAPSAGASLADALRAKRENIEEYKKAVPQE